MSASSNATGAETESRAHQFPVFVANNRPRIEAALKEHLPVSSAPGTERFNEAMKAALSPGGKRLRPLLSMIGSSLGGASDSQALTLACAIEFIHTSSLILDDLPAMDDAHLRRNRPTLHLVFGEGIAIVAAVALLNQAYALFANAADEGGQAENLPSLLREATACIGHAGMIAGQAAELGLSEASTDELLLSTRELKTTSLMRLGMIAGGIISGAPDEHIVALATYGERLGQAYQIYDDLADALGDHGSTGKSVGQDLRHLRPTVVRGLPPEQVRSLAAGVVESGKQALAPFGDRPEAELLRSAADHIVAGLNPADSSKKPIS